MANFRGRFPGTLITSKRCTPGHLVKSGLAVILAMTLAACEAGEIARPAPAPPGLPPAAWYHLYFTGPTPDQLEGGIPEAIVTSLDAAQKTIDVAIYELDLPSIASALTRAQTRGVRLRLVTDSDSLEMPFIQDLLKAKVPVVADGRQAFMHDKFIVIDELTGEAALRTRLESFVDIVGLRRAAS